jgi:hypothetical protein
MCGNEVPKENKSAIEELACFLHREMEANYPNADAVMPDWESLEDSEKDYWREAIFVILQKKALLIAALGISDTEPTTT